MQLKTKQVADMLQISHSHVYWLINKGLLPARRLTQRNIIIEESDVINYIDSINQANDVFCIA
jgi:predicted DNA-binding transcriptional regulator AlpA